MEGFNIIEDDDFKLMNDALEVFATPNSSEYMVERAIASMLSEKTGAPKDHVDRLLKEHQKKKAERMTMLTENIRLLQGKLIRLKRELVMQRNTDAANDILNNKH